MWPEMALTSENVKFYILVALLYCGSPFALIFIVTPVFLMRVIAILLQKVFKKEIWKILDPRSACFSGSDDPYKAPKYNLVTVMKLAGPVSLDTLRENVSKIIETRDLVSGKLLYPEMKCSIESYLGFHFWKEETEFRTEDHVHKQDDIKNDKEALEKFAIHLIESPFRREKSPWEFILVPDKSSGPGSTVFFKVHHSLCDGFSIAKFLYRFSSLKEAIHTVPEKFDVSPASKIWYKLSSLAKVPFHYSVILFRCYDKNNMINRGRLITRLYPESNELNLKTMLVPIKDFTAIKKAQNVSMSSIILYGMSEAVRAWLTENGHGVPENISSLFIFGAPGHPNHFSNHFAFGIVTVPIELPERLKRLKKCEDFFQEAKSTLNPYVSFHLQSLFGSLFHWMLPYLLQNYLTTLSISSSFLFPKPYDFCGQNVANCHVSTGLSPSSSPIVAVLTSYFDTAYFSVAISKKFSENFNLSPEQVLTLFRKELNILKTL